jgi:hypothetical protein
MRVIIAITLLACLMLTACAPSDKRSDDSPFGGWYAGAHGGVAP